MPLPFLYLGLLASAFALPPAAPLSFQANRGQAGPASGHGARFLARSSGFTLFLTDEGAVIARSAPGGARPVRLELAGASPTACEGDGLTDQRSHYLLGDDPAKWVTDVPHYSRVVYRSVYPGIDLVFHAGSGDLEFDFAASPGADLDAIGLEFEGADRVDVDASGDLLLYLADGVLRQKKPVVYQVRDQGREPLDGSYVIDAGGIVRFHVGRHDTSLATVIDPILVFSSLIGTSEGDLINGITVDRFGSAFVTGFTSSKDFPTKNGYQPKPKSPGEVTAFVTKFSPTGRDVLWSTYLGGTRTSWGKSIALTASGNPLVSGWTDADNFPSKSPLQNKPGGGFDIFLTALAPAGNALVFSTTWGGAGDERAEGMALDTSGIVYLVGETESSDFPRVAPLDDTLGGTRDAFVMKIKESFGAVLYATFLGGKGTETARGVAVAGDEVFVTGETRSPDFPLKAAFQGMLKGTSDAFVTRLKVDGKTLSYSTYLGGAGSDDGWAIAADPDGHAYVAGRASGGFPLKGTLFDPLGNTLLFVTKLEPDGSAPVFSTLLGSNVSGIPEAIALNSARDVYVGGAIVYLGDGFSILPSRGPPLQPIYGGGASDGFVYRLDSTGAFFRYASFLGGSQGDEVTSLALGEKGDVYAAGLTGSANFPTTLGAYDLSHNGQNDGFVARMDTLNYPDDPPYLTPGAPAKIPLTAATPFKRYRVVIPPGLRAVVTASDADPNDWNALYARYNGEARPHTFDYAAEDRGNASQRLVIPETQAGELYLYVQATRINGPSNAITIQVDAVDFAFDAITPRRIAAGSRFHASVRGAGFRSDAVFTIARMSGGPTLTAQEIQVLSSSRADVVFDLTGQPQGAYRLKGFNPNAGSSGLENALEVVPAGTPGMLDVTVSGRDTCRFNRPTSLRVNYENAGDEEMAAPILRLRAPTGVELRLEDDPTFRGNTLDLLAINPDGPGGILAPGAGGSIAVVYRSTLEGPVDLTLDQLTPNDGDAINWSTLPAPQGFSAAEWNSLRTPLGAVLGSTWRAYRDALDAVATRLLRRGLGGPTLLGVRELFRRAVLEAKGTFPGSAVVGRALRSPSNSPLGRVLVLALEGAAVKSAAVTDAAGNFALECLSPGTSYDFRVWKHDTSPVQTLIPADGSDTFNVELRAIEAPSSLTPAASSCDAYVLPGKALEAPQSLFTSLETFSVQVLRSHDPNEKDGPEGEGPKRHIGIGQELLYTIHFENTGNSNAQTVIVTDPLDENIDWSTFRMLEAGVADLVFSLDAIPGGTSQVRQGYSGRRTQGGLRPESLYSGVEARCDFDPLTGLLTWTFDTVNPTNGDRPPASAFEGFLQPNTSPPRGEGWGSFSVYPKQTLADDSVIRNDGSIVFDDPPDVATNSVFNLIQLDGLSLRAPRNPYPANGTSRQVETLGLYLTWDGDPRSETYDVRFWKDGETKPQQPRASGLADPFHVPERAIEEGFVYRWQVTEHAGSQSVAGPEWSFRTVDPQILPGAFLRGDANADGQRDISDATYVLAYLFTGGPPPTCFDSADTNDDGALDISDPSALLGYLFLGTMPVLARPFETCGPDPTGDTLTCEAYGPCG